MIKLKSLLCMCLIVTMLFGIPHASFAQKKELQAESTAEICRFLKAVGIIPQEEQFPAEDEALTRAYFVKLALHASNDAPKVLVSEDEVFLDVTPETAYENYIETAFRIGYISGSDSGLFNPESTVTLEQALKILCSILGYDNAAKLSGGYPVGYISTARRYGLLDSVDIAGGSQLTFADGIRLINNALNAEIMQPVSINEIIEYKTFEDETLLSERHHVIKAEGIIDSNAYTSLITDETDCSKGVAALNGEFFKTGDSGAENYIGYSVELYYKEDEATLPTALYVTPSADCKILKCLSRDLAAANDSLLVYDEEGDAETVRFDTFITCILNGKMSTVSPLDLPDFPKAEITLISNDGDSKYDVALITSYETYRTAGVSAESCLIVTNDGKQIELDPDSDDYTFELIKNGRPVDISAVSADDVLLVAASEGEGLGRISILVSDSIVNSKFDEIGDDTAVLGGKEYHADAGVLSSAGAGKEYKIYIDAMGNISFIQIQNDMVYGYLYGVARQGLDEPVCCIFTENANWVELKFAGRVRFNQSTVSAYEVFETLGTDADSYRQLIRYNVNEDALITVLETASSVPIASEGEQAAVQADTFRLSYEGSARWRSSPLSFDGRFYVDASSKMFVIPSDMAKSQFRMMAPSRLPGDVLYSDIKAYDADSDLLCGAVTIIGNIEQTVSDSDSFMVVKSKGQILNKNGDAKPSLKGYWRGIEMSFPLDTVNGSLTQDTVDSLEYGDIIQFKTNAIGEIDHIILHKAADGEHYILNSLYSIFTIVGARVEKCSYDTQKIKIAYNADGEHRSFIYGSSTRVYLWDAKSGTCRKATPAEILEDDMIYASLRYLSAREIIVIRNMN